jgi:putative endonuclease
MLLFICTMFYVYVLVCGDGTTYTGYTKDIQERMHRHNNKMVPYTASKQPLKLVHYSVFIDKYKAIFFEKYLKSGSGRAFMKRHLL